MAPNTVYSQATSNNAGSVAVTDNAAMQLNDLRVVFISVSNTTCSTPSGWTQLMTYTLATTRNGYVFSKAHQGGSEAATHTFTFGAANNFSMAQIGVRNADLGALDFTPTGNSAASGTTLTATGGTTTRAPGLILACYHVLLNSSSLTLTVPSGMTQEVFQAGTGTAGHAIGLYSQAQSSAGSTGSPTSTSSATGAWGAELMVVPPLVTGIVAPLVVASRMPQQPWARRRPIVMRSSLVDPAVPGRFLPFFT